MRSLRAWLSRALGTFVRRRHDDELVEELANHVDLQIADNLRAGLPADEARRVALVKMGGIEPTREQYRDRVRVGWIDNVLRDLRLSVRMLRRTPGFSAITIAILALVIGANAAVYALVDRLFLGSLPYPDADRLVTVERHYQQGAMSRFLIGHSGVMAFAVRDAIAGLDVAMAGSSGGVNIFANGHADYAQQQRVSTGFFRVLGVAPALGREFSTQEDHVGGPPVVILSHAIWKRFYDGDASVIGRMATVRGEPHTIIGVMPSSFRTLTPADLWTPLRPSTTGEGSGQNYQVFARLRPGTTFNAADAQLRSVGTALLEGLFHPPPDLSMTMRLSTLQDGLMGDIRQPTFILWSAVGILLLLGCVNIAGLLLVRGSARAREIATRMALGAGRAAIIRQLLVESVVLAACGGAAGVVVGAAIIRAARATFEGVLGLPIALDSRVLLVTLVGALLTSVIFGLFPAIYATGTNVRGALVEGGSASIAGQTRQWPARSMVVTQIALSIVLLVSAGLLMRSFQHLANRRPGFDGTSVMAGTASLQDVRYRTSAQINDLFNRSLDRMQQIPGVEAAAVGLSLPYERSLNMGWRFAGEPESQQQSINLTYVTPDYFKTLRIALLRGRLFTDHDASGSNVVAVVNRAFVQRYARDADPVGWRLQLGRRQAEIVGIVDAVQVQNVLGGNLGPVAAIPGAYVPAAQYDDGSFALAHTWFEPSWIVRTASGSAASIVPAMRAAMRDVDPQLPFNRFRSLDEVRDAGYVLPRSETIVFGSLAGLALVLSALGVYGLVSHSVARRRRELSVRVALGATPAHILRTTVGTTLVLGLAGVLIGVAMAWSSARVMRGLVFGLSVTDLPTYATAAVAMFLTVGIAALWPAIRTLRANQNALLRGF